jgi:hypothetical protein
MPTSSRVLSARLPMRINASTTITTPRLDAEQRAVDHRDALAHDVEQAEGEHHQRARSARTGWPAASPPRTPCSSQPT